MTLKFVNYVAFAAAGKQVDRDMREFRQSYGTESGRKESAPRASVGTSLKKEVTAKRTKR